MLNDVKFNNNDKSAYLDWNIVLTKVDIPLPEPKTSTVDIKGADGLLDLSEVLTGDILYNNRQIKLTFEMMDVSRYYDLMSEISNYLHGKIVTFVLSNDDNFYYKGRASINEWECVKQKGIIVITVDAEPYKYEVDETIINISLSGKPVYYNLTNLRKRICPIFTVSGNVSVNAYDLEYDFEEGEQQIPFLQLEEGDNIWLFNGNGTVKVVYRRCSL